VKAHHCCTADVSGSGTAPFATPSSDGGRRRPRFVRRFRDTLQPLNPYHMAVTLASNTYRDEQSRLVVVVGDELVAPRVFSVTLGVISRGSVW
jgi:hypothetical protein